MPNRNGTGPEGKGSRTGRGLGNCADDTNTNTKANEDAPRGFFGLVRGLGRRSGKGAGAGRGFGFNRNNN
jgi:hypothetical protein